MPTEATEDTVASAPPLGSFATAQQLPTFASHPDPRKPNTGTAKTRTRKIEFYRRRGNSSQGQSQQSQNFYDELIQNKVLFECKKAKYIFDK